MPKVDHNDPHASTLRVPGLQPEGSAEQLDGPSGPPPLAFPIDNLQLEHTALTDTAEALILVDVPQARSYMSKLQRRYTREPSIYFFTHNSRGIRLSDALHGNFVGLVDPDVVAVEGHGDKMTYMFEWPGYRKVAKQMNAHRKKTGAVQSRSRIARQVATVVDQFIGRQADVVSSNPVWRVGEAAIDLQHIYLTEVKRISSGTWVVELAVDFRYFFPFSQ